MPAAMTNHHPAADRKNGPPPTPKQQRYLRALATSRGISFTPPTTKREASRLIDQLRRRPPDTQDDRTRELRAIQADLQTRGDAATVRADEITGHGSNCTWKRGAS